MTSLAHLDLRTLLALYGGPSGAWATAMVALTLLGSGWTALVLLPVALHPRSRRFGLALAMAILAQATLVWVLKALVGRVRPWVALGLPAPFGSPRDFSFPSGHAAGSFCVATFLAFALPAAWPSAPGRARAVVASVTVVAAFIASSRVYLGAHFPGDVLFGALVGCAVGAVAGTRYLRDTRERSALGDASDTEAPMERAPERG